MDEQDIAVFGDGRRDDSDGASVDVSLEDLVRPSARSWNDGRRPRWMRAEFLSEASRLLADSLDYETTLSTVARMALPHLGAWCIVDVVEADGTLRRLSIVHPDPRRQRLTRRLADGWPPRRDDPIGVPLVMRTRCPEVVPVVTDELLVEVSRNGENLEILRELGLGSVIVVPLIARDEVMGAITFVTPEGEPPCDDEDVALAEDLAARCAIAIENARLYEEARRARQDAETANRAKSQFLAMTSHEIRTPINAVMGYADLLELGLAGPLTEEQRAYIERIQAGSQHLLGLVNEILDLAKVEAGQMTVHRERANLTTAVAAATEMVYPQAAAAGIDLEQDCEVGVGAWYVADPDRVRQIIVNLLGNAIKFTDRGGRVRVRCGVTGELPPEARVAGGGSWAYVSVEDTGVGIAPEQQRRIFEPFVQASEGKTRTREGSGLGLAIARQIARLMGGDLTVRSAPGEGSTFTLWLPVAPDLGEEIVGRDRRAFARETEGLRSVGTLLLERVTAILDTYTARLRADPQISPTDTLSDTELQDHVLALLTEIAQMLKLSDVRGGLASGVLRDGCRIQQTIAQLHGVQRRTLGWSEDAIHRDFAALRAAVEVEIRAVARGEGKLDEAIAVVARILDRAERTSIRSWRLAATRVD